MKNKNESTYRGNVFFAQHNFHFSMNITVCTLCALLPIHYSQHLALQTNCSFFFRQVKVFLQTYIFISSLCDDELCVCEHKRQQNRCILCFTSLSVLFPNFSYFLFFSFFISRNNSISTKRETNRRDCCIQITQQCISLLAEMCMSIYI